jgi:excinuclease UvrABC nuclease subunit
MLQADMLIAAEATQFEDAARLRDQMLHVKELVDQHDDDENPLLVRRSEIEAVMNKGLKGRGKIKKRQGSKGAPGTRGKGRTM